MTDAETFAHDLDYRCDHCGRLLVNGYCPWPDAPPLKGWTPRGAPLRLELDDDFDAIGFCTVCGLRRDTNGYCRVHYPRAMFAKMPDRIDPPVAPGLQAGPSIEMINSIGDAAVALDHDVHAARVEAERQYDDLIKHPPAHDAETDAIVACSRVFSTLSKGQAQRVAVYLMQRYGR